MKPFVFLVPLILFVFLVGSVRSGDPSLYGYQLGPLPKHDLQKRPCPLPSAGLKHDKPSGLKHDIDDKRPSPAPTSGLKLNFYKKTCPDAEQIVQNITWNHVASNPNMAAKLLRLPFHDCFLRGCDASLLLDAAPNNSNSTEKKALPNLSLGGFEIIDEIKSALEKACPGVVSCADIIQLAGRDGVSFQFKRPMWEVETGRRDGNVSNASEVVDNLPSGFADFTSLLQNFSNKGLDLHDLVVLSGAHTIGVGNCFFINIRLYNFTGVGDADPSLDPTYAAFLRTQCKNLTDFSTFLPIDPGSGQSFDGSYYKNLKLNKGLFESDATLLTNQRSRILVDKLVDTNSFFRAFKESIRKLGRIELLTGNQGEIRKNCRVVN